LRKRKAEITRTCYKHSRERENGFSFRCRPRPQPTSPALSLPEFSGRWAVGGGRWAMDVGRWLCVALRRRQADKCWNVSYAIYHRALEQRPSGCPPVRLSACPSARLSLSRLVGSKLSARSMASLGHVLCYNVNFLLGLWSRLCWKLIAAST